jgi:hypothetical protein
MEMNFLNVECALVHLGEKDTQVSKALAKLLAEHAVKGAEVKITGVADEINRMKFDSDEKLSDVIEVGDEWVISIISGEDETAWANVFPRHHEEAQAAADSVKDTTDNPTSPTSTVGAEDASVKSEKANANESIALKVGKVVLTVAAVGAAIGAGVWAWKKWSKSST